MKKMTHFFSAAFLLTLLTGNVVYGQHAGDIELGYDNLVTPNALVIEEVEVTSEGILLFEAEFEELDPFNPGDYSADEPGFNTNAAEGLLVNPGDQIWINALDASAASGFGVGYVNYYNPLTDSLEATGRIEIQDNSSGTSHLVLDGTSISSTTNPQFIDAGDSGGDVHDHVIFDLLDDATAPLGAYGVLFELQADFDMADGNMDLTSDSFWIVFNHGMSESDFENMALPRFGAGSAVPEPGMALVILVGTVAMGMRRRRAA